MSLKVCLNSFFSNPALVFLLICLTLGGIACSDSQSAAQKDIIVRYRQHYLSRDEIDHFIPDGMKGADSVKFAHQYIDEWIRSQAIAEYIRGRVSGIDRQMSYKASRYEQELIQHEYAAWLASENPGTFIVSEVEIRDYYEKYPEKFVSTQDYYQFFFVRTENNSYQDVIPLLRSGDAEKIRELDRWAQQNAVEHRLDSSYVDNAEIERIAEGFNYGNIRRASKSTPYPYTCTLSGQTFYNYYRLINIVKTGDILPLRICRSRIANIIINQRKNSMIEQAQNSLVQQAKSAKKFVRYDK